MFKALLVTAHPGLLSLQIPPSLNYKKYYMHMYCSKDNFLFEAMWGYNCNAQRGGHKELSLFGSLAYGPADMVRASAPFHLPTPAPATTMFSALSWHTRQDHGDKTTSDTSLNAWSSPSPPSQLHTCCCSRLDYNFPVFPVPMSVKLATVSTQGNFS